MIFFSSGFKTVPFRSRYETATRIIESRVSRQVDARVYKDMPRESTSKNATTEEMELFQISMVSLISRVQAVISGWDLLTWFTRGCVSTKVMKGFSLQTDAPAEHLTFG